MSNVRDYTHRPAAEAAEGTRPAGQAEDAESVSARDLQRLEKRVLFAARDWRVARETTNQREMNEASWALVGAVDKWRNPFSCGKCGHARCEACGEFPCDVDHGRLCDKPAAGVEPPVVAVAGREASATVEHWLDQLQSNFAGADETMANANTARWFDEARADVARLRSELSTLRQQLEAERTELKALTSQDFQKYHTKAKVYGEMAYKWRRRAIAAGLADEEDRILADEWQARERRIAELEAERHQAWERGYAAGFGIGAYDPNKRNPYPPPAEAPALPVGKETEP